MFDMHKVVINLIHIYSLGKFKSKATNVYRTSFMTLANAEEWVLKLGDYQALLFHLVFSGSLE